MHIYSLPKTDSSAPQFPVAVMGAAGYSGQELVRALAQHPYVSRITLLTHQKTIEVDQLWPEDFAKPIHTLNLNTWLELKTDESFAFLATPAEGSLDLIPQLINKNLKVIDLSGAFRFKNPEVYPKWYNFSHSALNLLNEAVYGLSPWSNADDLQNTKIVANPGCYATSILMALLPLLKNQLMDPSTLVIDAKSGTSGAGRKALENLLYTEVDGECLPYKIGHHQHFPEICEYAKLYTGQTIDPMLSTSLLPTRRGIIAALYARTPKGITLSDIANSYQHAYESYVGVRAGAHNDSQASLRLSLKKVVGSPRTHITYALEGQKLYVYSTIDNLMKGAATQAIENFNRMNGWPVFTGLSHREGVL